MGLDKKFRDVIQSDEYREQVIRALSLVQNSWRMKRLVEDTQTLLRNNAQLAAQKLPNQNVYVYKPELVGIDDKVASISILFIVNAEDSEITLCRFDVEPVAEE